MFYWYEAYNLEAKQNTFQDSIIAVYARKTGVQASSIKELDKTLDFSAKLTDDCLKENEVLKADNLELAPFKLKARKRGIVIAIAIPTSLIIGYGTGYAISKLSE